MRRFLSAAAGALALLVAVGPGAAQAAQPSRAQVESTMRKATEFMVDKVAYNGGYVWSYTADMKRRWGEMEAKPTQIWVQPPGTPTMGHLFLDAYHATGDEYYYKAAEKVADALIWGQLPTGGWNYLIDFGGDASLKDWYATIGANGWRLEEFQHYWGNATFDDDGTSEAMQFLLRMYVEKHDPKYKPALDKAINMVLKSQYPIGAWPQRWPLKHEFVHHGLADYTSYITYNDDVTGENLKFLIMVYQALGDPRVLDPIYRAMNSYIVTQQGEPQPGWGLQYTPLDLKPAAARSYEPAALVTHTTAQNIDQLMNFYELTGDTKFLARVPEALDWLDRVKLPHPTKEGFTHPTFLEVGTNQPLYVHRTGSNVVNGHYYIDHNPENTIAHYSSFRKIDTAALRARYEKLKGTDPATVSANSPLKAKNLVPLPRYFATRELTTSDLNVRYADEAGAQPSPDKVEGLVTGLNREGYWPTLLRATSHPYTGATPPAKPDGDYSNTRVGDITDTSPYSAEHPVPGISTGMYIENMATLIDWLSAHPAQAGRSHP